MPYVNITSSSTGSNVGSCGQLVEYLEKENRQKPLSEQEHWFNQQRDDILPQQVRQDIDANTAKLKRSEAKFYLINISPSQKELQHVGNNPEKLKDYARRVMAEYAANFQKGLGADDVKWYGKVEYKRDYKWNDPAVQQGLSQRGDGKPGSQLHVQIIVSRKDSHNQKLLSPLTNHRGQGKSEAHGQKFGQFNRVNFKERSEVVFDQQLGYHRALEETFRYQNTMSHGLAPERAGLLVEQRDQERRQQQQVAESQRLKEEQRQQEQAQKLRRIEQQQQAIEKEKKRGRGLTL